MARRLSMSRKGHSIFDIEPKICFTRDENIIKHALHHRLRSCGDKTQCKNQQWTKRTATEMWSHAAAAGYRNISFRTLPPTQVIYIFTSTTFIVHWKQENEENIL